MDVLRCLNIDGCGRISNRSKLLSLIQAAGKIGRAELARSAKISVQAASNITEDLLRAGLIRPAGQSSPQRGGPVALYELNPGGAFAMGFEIRPDVLFAAVIDLCGNRQELRRLPLADRSLCAVTRLICDQAADMAGTLGIATRMIGAGIAMPGPFGKTGLPVSSTSLDGWDRQELAEAVSDRLCVKVLADKDATAGICAEHMSGPARGIGEFAYLYFGMGLGLGLMSAGKPLSGAFGNLGEIGHLPSLGRCGIIEDTLSRSGLGRHLSLHGIEAHTIDELARYHGDGHRAVTSWLAQSSPQLGYILSVVENLFDPKTIIIGGAMPEGILRALIDMTPLPADTVSVRPNRELPRVQLGACHAHTACLGAATMMLNDLFSNPKVM